MTYTFDITPIPAPRMVSSDKWAEREAVLRYFQYKEDLGWLAKASHYIITEMLNITFYLPMPKSWPEEKRLEMNGHPHRDTPDVDNMLKAFLDALCESDAHIWHIDAAKYWAEKGSIVVTVPDE